MDDGWGARSGEPYRDRAGRTLEDYPRPSVAVDTALLTVLPGEDALSVLQVRRAAGGGEEAGWALPGTFLHPGERLIDAVLRSLREKAGIERAGPRQLHVFDDPGRDPRGWVLSVAHVAVVPAARLDGRFRDQTRLAPAHDPGDMAYGHAGIVASAVADVRARYAEHPDPDRLLAEPFTVLDLRLLHEAITGRPLQRDTFRRLMEPRLARTGTVTSGSRGRPAELFRHQVLSSRLSCLPPAGRKILMPLIGTSDLDVYPLNLGGNTFGWTTDEQQSFAVLDGYAAAGGNFVDTADSYSAFAPGNSGGESESVIGAWTKARGNRDQVIIATKVSQHPQFRGLAAGNVKAACEASLARLGTDYIDLYYAHYDDASTPIEETVAAFAELQQAGKIRHVGVSNYTAARIREWAAAAQAGGHPLPVALQPHYSLVARQPYEADLAPVAAEYGLGVMPYFSLAAGFLTGKYREPGDTDGHGRRGAMASRYLTPEGLRVLAAMDKVGAAHEAELASVAIAWLLAKPGVTAPIASATSPAQLASLTAATTLKLTPAEVAALDQASSPA